MLYLPESEILTSETTSPPATGISDARHHPPEIPPFMPVHHIQASLLLVAATEGLRQAWIVKRWTGQINSIIKSYSTYSSMVKRTATFPSSKHHRMPWSERPSANRTEIGQLPTSMSNWSLYWNFLNHPETARYPDKPKQGIQSYFIWLWSMIDSMIWTPASTWYSASQSHRTACLVHLRKPRQASDTNVLYFAVNLPNPQMKLSLKKLIHSGMACWQPSGGLPA